MAIQYNKDFWERPKTLTSHELSSYEERKSNLIEYTLAQKNIARGTMSTTDYQEMLAGKKAWANSIMSEKDKTQSDFTALNNDVSLLDDPSNVDNYNAIVKSVHDQAVKEFLKSYYAAYMGKNSDIKWRLGELIGEINKVDISDERFGEIISGAVSTRSNMTYMYDWNYTAEDGSHGRTQRFFSSLGFPPYKIGANAKLGKKTDKMSKVLLTNPNPTFDQDKFSVKREDVVFRDVGMKSLSDWINYLQHISEGVTGIVSTYLTEWDLSVYIQEGLMVPKLNGGAMDVYLNYRIKKDNPLADNSSKNYMDDKALSFNVAGSAVSKLFYDCSKTWRPSDFPLSVWWMPYIKDRDWTLNELNPNGLNVTIPYLSFYDDLVVNYNYKNQSDLKEIFKHQDYIGLIARGANTMDNPYWSVFYSSENDGASNIDIKLANLINDVAGANPGALDGKDLNYLKLIGRKEAILNGGYYGGPTQVGQSGGLFGRTMLNNSMNNDGNDDTEKSISSIDSSSSEDPNYVIDTSTNFMNGDTSNDNKADAAQSSKMVGINRLSPAIYGGPHGSEYSPNHLRDYFNEKSLVSHQIPKIGFVDLSKNKELKKNSLTSLEKGKYTFSPSKALSYLKEGTYPKYKKLVYQKDWITRTFEGEVFFNEKTLQFEAKLPTTCDGMPIDYGTNIVSYKTKIFNVNELKSNVAPWVKYNRVNSNDGTLSLKVPSCTGKYYGFIEKTIDFYDVMDFPDLKWKITAHKFLSYTTDVGKKDSFYSGLNTMREGDISNEKGLKDLSSKTAYVLTCASPKDEEKIKETIIQYNKGITDSPKYLYFCGCDDINTRYTEGPSYIFKAPVYVRYYENTEEIYRTTFFGKKKKTGKVNVTYVPYLYVDLDNTEEYFDLGIEKTKIVRGSSENIPSHLVSISKTNALTYSPLQKMKVGLANEITSYKFSTTNGKNTSTDIKWTSKAEFGIEGIGILSGWQGIESYAKKSELSDSSIFDVSNIINRSNSDNADDIPIRDFPMSSISYDRILSYKKTILPFVSYMSNEGLDLIQGYKTTKIDNALKNAINQICTSIYFKLYDSKDVCKMDISEPFKNFLSYCQTELNYFRLTKDIFATLNFENIRKVLLNNVDPCVLKACGLQKISDENFVRISSDKKHILYNYWIEVAIDLFYDKSKYSFKRSIIEEKFEYIMSCLETTVNVVSDIVKKDSLDWTYNDFKTIFGQIYIQEENIKKNEIDEFFFAYLNILYIYRLFFIGKRFNKEDGTMWAMRQLESTINLVRTNESPAKSPTQMNESDKSIYDVIFYEIQNTLSTKREVVIDEDHEPLEVDKICRLYVLVEYCTKLEYDKWIQYRDDPLNYAKAREVICIKVDGEIKYLYKPIDGIYQFKSKEFNRNLKNEAWNFNHKDKAERYVKEYTQCIFPINWGPSEGKTPIRFNVLGKVNTSNLLEYSKESMSPKDLICLTEEGMDFWTVDIPMGLWPEKDLYKSKLYLKLLTSPTDIYNDVYTVVLGPFANSVSPIKRYNEAMFEDMNISV